MVENLPSDDVNNDDVTDDDVNTDEVTDDDVNNDEGRLFSGFLYCRDTDRSHFGVVMILLLLYIKGKSRH